MGQTTSNPEVLAAELCARKRCEGAITLLEAAFVSQPGNAELSHQIGLCYSGACRKHAMASLPVAIVYLERALALIGLQGPGAVRARYLDSLGNAQRANRQPDRALSPLLEAADIYQRLGAQDDWARTEYNLGNVCCELAEAGQPPMWNEAVRHYGAALRVRTEAADPLRFAATMQNLGTAYRELRSGNKVDNVGEAIRCYCAALRVYKSHHRGEKCADVHNNLGNAYLDLPDSPLSGCRNVRHALRHYTLALRVRNKSQRPHDYAVTQFNCGQGLLRLAECGSIESTNRAADCFHEALDAFLLCGDIADAEMVRQRMEVVGCHSAPVA